MDRVLLGEIRVWASVDPSLEPETAYPALAALEGQAELDALLDEPGPRPPVPPPVHAQPGVRVWLERIHLEGFRGVGPSATLNLAAGPGLTLVVGRNGSGKSSFAEGLELALTGTSERWEGRPNVWREGWRNLHAADGTTVQVTFRAEEHPEPLVVERQWIASDELDGGRASVRRGSEDLPGIAGLGWTAPLSAFRPLLSYNELGSMLTGEPSGLHHGPVSRSVSRAHH